MSEDKKDELKKLEEQVTSSFLTEEEKDKIRKQALKEIDEENKKRISEEFKASIKAEVKKKALFKNAKPGESADGLVSIHVDLPKVAECIRLDGVCYYPGHTYNVTPAVRDVIMEVMQRGFNHEDEVKGRKDANEYRRKSSVTASIS